MTPKTPTHQSHPIVAITPFVKQPRALSTLQTTLARPSSRSSAYADGQLVSPRCPAGDSLRGESRVSGFA